MEELMKIMTTMRMTEMRLVVLKGRGMMRMKWQWTKVTTMRSLRNRIGSCR